MKNLLKVARKLLIDDLRLRKSAPHISQFDNPDVQKFLEAFFKDRRQTEQLAAEILAAILFYKIPNSFIALNDCQELIHNSKNIEKKFNLRSNGSQAYRCVWTLLDKLKILVILIPSSKNHHKPAYFEVRDPEILAITGPIDEEIREAAYLYHGLKYPPAPELQQGQFDSSGRASPKEIANALTPLFLTAKRGSHELYLTFKASCLEILSKFRNIRMIPLRQELVSRPEYKSSYSFKESTDTLFDAFDSFCPDECRNRRELLNRDISRYSNLAVQKKIKTQAELQILLRSYGASSKEDLSDPQAFELLETIKSLLQSESRADQSVTEEGL